MMKVLRRFWGWVVDRRWLTLGVTSDPGCLDEPYLDRCDDCGTLASVGSGCITCMPCDGEYNPGTEECDFCHVADDCIAPRNFPS